MPHAAKKRVEDAAIQSEAEQVAAFGALRFNNRELSWLQFNRRVLEESENVHHPLLERVRFLSISASNLDEFYMVRVAGLIGQVNASVTTTSTDGLTPSEQLKKINEMVASLTQHQQQNWATLKAELDQNGITIVDPKHLRKHEREWLEPHFMSHIFPILTPIAIDPAHPFPFIPTKGFVLGLECQKKDTPDAVMHSILPIPSQLDRFIRLPPEDGRAKDDASADPLHPAGIAGRQLCRAAVPGL